MTVAAADGLLDLRLLPTTDQSCRDCEDGTYVRDGYELICETCQHTPTKSDTSLDIDSPFERHRQQLTDGDDRPRPYGGYMDAYWGEGSYEYHPDGGFSR